MAELDLADHVTLAEIDPDVSAVWDVVLNGQASAFAQQINSFRLNRSTAAETIAREPTDQVSRAFRCLLPSHFTKIDRISLIMNQHIRRIDANWFGRVL